MTSKNALSEIENNSELRQEVIDQLNKDFGSNVSDFCWNDLSVDPFLGFVSSFENFLENMISNDKSSLMQILYRIDVFESKLKLVWTYEVNERASRLASVILDRELQKVLTRRMYRQK